MNKTVVWIVVLVVVVVGGYALFKGKPSSVASNEPIKIGVIVPLTGNLAFIGEAARNGANLAIDKVNTNTGLKHKYSLVIEDDSFDAKKTASAINKLMSIDKVDAVVSLSSTAGNVVAPIAEQNKLPHIGLASDSNVAKGDYNFIHWTRPQEEVDVMISELVKRKLTKVSIIGVNQQGFKAINDDLVKKSSGAGITVVDNEVFNPGDKDFKTTISRAGKNNPDIYILGAFTPELEILAKQMKDLGIKQPLTSIESFGVTDKPAIFEGQWFIDAAVSSGGFNDEYKTKYRKEVGPTAANTYDAVNLLVMAVEAAGNYGRPTGAEIVKQLLKVNDYSGAFGKLSVSPEGEFISQPSVKIIKDGKAVELK